MFQQSNIDSLKPKFRGQLITPEDADYDRARALYNGLIDKRPRVIARCADAADVVTALRFARANELTVAVRGGGHNGAGLGSVDGGLVIDLSLCKNIHVDPTRRVVTAGPGCTQAELDAATHEHGLAVPAGIVGSTGIAGLTLGGGHGYLSRRHGLTVDNLLEAEVVLADGRIVVASATETRISSGPCVAAAATSAS